MSCTATTSCRVTGGRGTCNFTSLRAPFVSLLIFLFQKNDHILCRAQARHRTPPTTHYKLTKPASSVCSSRAYHPPGDRGFAETTAVSFACVFGGRGRRASAEQLGERRRAMARRLQKVCGALLRYRQAPPLRLGIRCWRHAGSAGLVILREQRSGVPAVFQKNKHSAWWERSVSNRAGQTDADGSILVLSFRLFEEAVKPSSRFKPALCCIA